MRSRKNSVNKKRKRGRNFQKQVLLGKRKNIDETIHVVCRRNIFEFNDVRRSFSKFQSKKWEQNDSNHIPHQEET